MSKERDLEIVNSHLAQLAEHFDTVQIFATRHENQGTINIQIGEGNFYARYGHICLWVKDEEKNNDNFSIQRLDEEEEE